MSQRLKWSAFITFVLAAAFSCFFQVSKHTPVLAPVNVFAEDPYDAVASFAVQFAIFTGLLSLVRAFRPYQARTNLDEQELLLLRTAYLSYLSIAVTLVADSIALLRHTPLWFGAPGGFLLAAMVGGMALLTLLGGWPVLRFTCERRSPPGQGSWLRAIGIFTACVLLLLFYPEGWRENLVGELFTVLVGAATLFVPLWAIESAIFPAPPPVFEDSLDDFAAIFRWLRVHLGPFALFVRLLEGLLRWPPIGAVVDWVNPRRHTWHLAVLLGVSIGLLLMVAEALGEGGMPQHLEQLLLVTAVYVGLECMAVLLGYALLARPLGLFRKTPGDQAKSAPLGVW